jgi:hypothetical protein
MNTESQAKLLLEEAERKSIDSQYRSQRLLHKLFVGLLLIAALTAALFAFQSSVQLLAPIFFLLGVWSLVDFNTSGKIERELYLQRNRYRRAPALFAGLMTLLACVLSPYIQPWLGW